eukprot:CFRG3181T1
MTHEKNVIAHIGLGNFSRAHLARYMHDFNVIAERENFKQWEIRAVDRDTQRTNDLIKCFEQSNYTYNLRTSSETIDKTIKISCITELTNMGVDPSRAIKLIADIRTKIVTLTVTEKGYCCDLASGKLIMNRDLEHDLTVEGANSPKSMLGLVTEALRVRMLAGLPPVTLMSMDNIPGNGALFRNAIIEFVSMTGNTELLEWIKTHVTFPSTMVDRITPNTLNASDAVVCEPYRQWVVETSFCNERPQWEYMVGQKLILTNDVIPYEHVKVRLLNGTHSVLAYSAFLCEHTAVDKAMADSRLQYLTTAAMRETVSTVHQVEGMNLQDYMDMLTQRFGNPKVSDTISRLCEDGSMKASSFWKPVIMDHIVAQQKFPVLSIAIASWIRFSLAIDSTGVGFTIKDPAMAEELKALACIAFYQGNVQPFLEAAFGEELGKCGFFTNQVSYWYKRISVQGGMDGFLTSMEEAGESAMMDTPDLSDNEEELVEELVEELGDIDVQFVRTLSRAISESVSDHGGIIDSISA